MKSFISLYKIIIIIILLHSVSIYC